MKYWTFTYHSDPVHQGSYSKYINFYSVSIVVFGARPQAKARLQQQRGIRNGWDLLVESAERALVATEKSCRGPHRVGDVG
jgi:hypothetical protein